MKPILICFPFAAGNKYSYNHFVKDCPIRIVTVEYPGHGSRLNEPLLKNIDAIVDDAYCQVKHFTNQPYAFYGHSMGTLIALLVTKRIVSEKLTQPIHLFMSGRGAPSANDSRLQMHKLPQKQIIERLREMGGCPEEVLNNESLMDLYTPIFRADLQAIETYKYHQTEQIDIPLSVMFGKEDDITINSIEKWQLETSKSIEIIEFSGKHFFINDFSAELTKIILKKLI